MLSPAHSLTLPVVLLVAALQGFSALGGTGYVLCVERDGVVAVEAGRASCCASDDGRPSEARRVGQSSSHQDRLQPRLVAQRPSGSDGQCVECSDVRVAAGDQRTARSESPPLCSAPSPLSDPAVRFAVCPPPLKMRAPGQDRTVDPRPLQALETVVLRR